MLPQSQVLFQVVGLHLVEDSRLSVCVLIQLTEKYDKAMWLSGTREAGLMIAGEWRLLLTTLEVRVLLKREPSTMMVATSLDQQVESDCTVQCNRVIVQSRQTQFTL